MRKKRDWSRMKNNCLNILTFVSKHPMQGLTSYDISRELDIPESTVRYLIKCGKCEAVALDCGFKTKIFRRKPNVIEAVFWGFQETRKEIQISQEDNYNDSEKEKE